MFDKFYYYDRSNAKQEYTSDSSSGVIDPQRIVDGESDIFINQKLDKIKKKKKIIVRDYLLYNSLLNQDFKNMKKIDVYGKIIHNGFEVYAYIDGKLKRVNSPEELLDISYISEKDIIDLAAKNGFSEQEIEVLGPFEGLNLVQDPFDTDIPSISKKFVFNLQCLCKISEYYREKILEEAYKIKNNLIFECTDSDMFNITESNENNPDNLKFFINFVKDSKSKLVIKEGLQSINWLDISYLDFITALIRSHESVRLDLDKIFDYKDDDSSFSTIFGSAKSIEIKITNFDEDNFSKLLNFLKGVEKSKIKYIDFDQSSYSLLPDEFKNFMRSLPNLNPDNLLLLQLNDNKTDKDYTNSVFSSELEELEISFKVSFADLKNMLKNCNKLKHIKVNSHNSLGETSGFRLPSNLESLIISQPDSIDDVTCELYDIKIITFKVLEEITANCVNLKFLSLNSSESLGEVLNYKLPSSLEKLSLFAVKKTEEEYLTQNDIESLISNCKKLKSLEITEGIIFDKNREFKLPDSVTTISLGHKEFTREEFIKYTKDQKGYKYPPKLDIKGKQVLLYYNIIKMMENLKPKYLSSNNNTTNNPKYNFSQRKPLDRSFNGPVDEGSINSNTLSGDKTFDIFEYFKPKSVEFLHPSEYRLAVYNGVDDTGKLILDKSQDYLLTNTVTKIENISEEYKKYENEKMEYFMV